MSNKSCADIMFFMKEFLQYKVEFFDPMIMNMNNIISCIEEKDVQIFNIDYGIFYQGINECLENADYCFKVCQ